MKKYTIKKEEARQEAIEWQHWATDKNISYKEASIYLAYFEQLGRKYGLLREFRENGII